MINKITDNFIKWCQRYTQEKTCRYKREAFLLIEQLNGIESIEVLRGTLPFFQNSSHAPSFFSKDTIDPFIEKTKEFIESINTRAKINIQLICSQLDDVSTNEQTKDLVDLIKETLNISNILLHEHILGFLYKLENITEVQTIIAHLSEQPTSPRPDRPQRGSFDAFLPLSDKHSTCLDLLRNNSKTFSSSNSNCCQANHFLQTFLIIYQEVHTHPHEASIPTSKERALCSFL